MTIYITQAESATVYYKTRYKLKDNAVQELRASWSPDDGDFLSYIRDAIYDDIEEWCNYVDREEIDSDNWEIDDWDTSDLDTLEEDYPQYFQDINESPEEQFLGEF